MRDFADRFDERFRHTRKRLGDFRAQVLHFLPEHEQVLHDISVYAVGSAGRGEIGEHSDLDLFSVSVAGETSNLDQILIKAAILRANRACCFPEPSRDGSFLTVQSVGDFTKNFGNPDDDFQNTFTARMLLLLESAPIVGDSAYDRLIDEVLGLYWINLESHTEDHLPIILINDIVRYWRVLLLNHEAKIRKNKERPAVERDAERRLASYKLKFSRCLTCFSAIVFLLAATRLGKGHVERSHAKEMVQLRPIERLFWTRKQIADPVIGGLVGGLVALYEVFLSESQLPKGELLTKFQDEDYKRDRANEGNAFGEKMTTLVLSFETANPLLRYVVV